MPDLYELEIELEGVRKEINYAVMADDDEELGFLINEEQSLLGQIDFERRFGVPESEA